MIEKSLKQLKSHGGITALGLALVVAIALIVPMLAYADNVQNDVTAAAGNGTITAGGSTTVNYRIVANNGDGQTGCNAADTSPATVTIIVPEGGKVTATPGSLTFTSCGADKQVVFTSGTVGDYDITVSVSDSGTGTYNTNPAKFTLHVLAPPPNTPPALTLPANITAEATSASGALVTFSASASDAEDGTLAVTCTPASDSTFPLDTTAVNCSVTDSGGLSASGSFYVTVQDTTPPTLALPTGITAEATSGLGAALTFTATASDLVDGEVPVTCTPASGSIFALGTTAVYCSATDAHSNTGTSSFSVTVQDTTPPTLTLPADITAEATSGLGAAVTFSASASDLVDGDVLVTCAPTSGSTFALGTTQVNCSATDTHSNTAYGSFNVTVVDTTPPTLTLPTNITTEATSASGAIVTFSASASDLVDGDVLVTCTPTSGSTFGLGTTPVNCSATDTRSNTASGSFTVKVVYLWTGFFQPVDNLPVLNKVKAGSAIPVKFRLGGDMTLNIWALAPGSRPIACDTNSPLSEVELTVTAGSSSLSYDAASGQYIYVWKTEKTWSNSCRELVVTLIDGTQHSAIFQFTK